MATLEEQIGAAYDAHRAGRRHDAEIQYRTVLSMHPSQVDTLFLLSSLIAESAPDEALTLADRALAASAGRGGIGIDEATLLDHGAACLARQSLAPEREIELLLKAQRLDPSKVDRLFRLAEAQRRAGQEAEAQATLSAYLEGRPHDANALSNLGTLQLQFGSIEAAITTLRKALALHPRHLNALTNLGYAYSQQGQLELAVEQHRAAVTLNPGFAEGWCNLAAALSRLDSGAAMLQSALEAAMRSIDMKPSVQARSLFAEIAGKMDPDSWDPALSRRVTTALLEAWQSPATLLPFAGRLLTKEPAMMRLIDRLANDADQGAADAFFPAALPDEAADATSLLCAMLTSGPISDAGWEAVLTAMRRRLLEASASASGNADMAGEMPGLYCALAQQCFINEYVYGQTPEESKAAEDLRDRLADAIGNGRRVPAAWVVTAACYFPLDSVPGASRLLEAHYAKGVRSVLKQQIQEPMEERNLRSTIPRLTDIEGQVSEAVRSQYEEHPYPRWVRLPKERARKFLNAFFQAKFPHSAFRRLANDRKPEILVAGCGTGQHSIEATLQFSADSRVLAVDLSMASLAYAKRKTMELGIESIDYAQADLLQLKSLGRTFDVIESVGVLHHMQDPFAGWKALLSLLRPNGLMKIGLYSRLARRDIVRVRKLIREEAVGSSSRDIRDFRQRLSSLESSEDYGLTTRFTDFFSISTCRDLLFHVQEHQMDLEEIAVFLKDNELVFLGFDIEHSVTRAYKKRFPSDSAAIDLGSWRTYEAEHPDTFAQMYQFWIQKAS
jgi:2-polyprenyl-3-methyl-5-hydroxy-6-metoxy-1,4-benzoquinol methylase/tetratricopeptide (TPR) repeat protein